MDPNANLARQRSIAAEILKIWDNCSDDGTLTPAQTSRVLALSNDLAELVQALDEWLSGHGFLPVAWHPPPTLNGTHVTRGGEAIYIPLPPELSRPIDSGCNCAHCKAHPMRTPRWDTLAVTTDPPKDGRADTAWTVHYPELRR